MQSSCLLRTPVPIPPGISNHRPYTLGCLPAQWGINPHSARNPSTMAYCFPIGRKRVNRPCLNLSVARGAGFFSTCTSSSLAPLGAKGSPLHLATDPLPERKHRQPVSFVWFFFSSCGHRACTWDVGSSLLRTGAMYCRLWDASDVGTVALHAGLAKLGLALTQRLGLDWFGH